MKKSLISPIVFSIFLAAANSFATTTELSLNDLRSRDASFDEKLIAAGFEGGTDAMEAMSVTITEDEGSDEVEIKVTEKGNSGPAKNSIALGSVAAFTVLNTFTLQTLGVQASLLHYQRRKDRYNTALTLTVSGGDNMSTVALTFDKFFFGKSGFSLGMGAQGYRVKNEDITTSRPELLVGLLAQAGKTFNFGSGKQFYGRVAVKMWAAPYGYAFYMMPSAEVGAGIILGKGYRSRKAHLMHK